MRHGTLRRWSAAVVAVGGVSMRGVSEARVGTAQYSAPWPEPGQPPQRPNPLSPHPTGLKMRKNSIEWKLHHGAGVRHGVTGTARELADFEYADGTPAPNSLKRFSLKHHQDSILVQLIRAGAVVENAASRGYLPRIPGVREQRDWDPEIPLFLEDADEHGKAPHWHYDGSRKAAATTTHSAATQSVIDRKFDTPAMRHGSRTLINANNQETLEPITMFASYDPSGFINEKIKLQKRRSPIWSRRRWALSEEYLVPKSPTPRNTIKDE